MAAVTAGTAMNMATAQVWSGSVTGATPTRITITGGFRTGVCLGTFAYDTIGNVFGTLTAYQGLRGSTLDFTVSGVQVDAFLAMNLINASQLQTLYEIGLVGNDTVSGSSSADYLLGYDGTLRGGAGNDTLDGGNGQDTAAFNQASRHFTITVSGETVTVKDRSNVDGTDTVLNVDRLQFGDGYTSAPSWMVKASQLDAARFSDLTALYIAYINRAPDAPGLEYWASRLVEGMTLQ